MPRDSAEGPWQNSGFEKRKPATLGSRIEQVTLSEHLREELLFLSTPEAHLGSVDMVRDPALKAALETIKNNESYASVYTPVKGSEGDSAERHQLKAAADEISTAAKALLHATASGRPIAMGELKRTHIRAFQTALGKIDACKEAFNTSGACDGQAASGHVWRKMLEGTDTLEALLAEKARGLVVKLETLADKKRELG